MVGSSKIRIGTRGSHLALAQAKAVRNALIFAHDLDPEIVDIVVISTAGDRIQNRSLQEIGGKGLFTADIEEQLLNRSLDFAVHSAKDMPVQLHEKLKIAAFLEREDVRDAFISNKANCLQNLAHGAIVGSSSLRRQALVKRIRPDLRILPLRGNVGTRLRKLNQKKIDATLLAYAGLKRLGLKNEVTDLLALEFFPPAPGQGAICIEIHKNNQDASDMLVAINHKATETEVMAERAFLAKLEGSCRTPLAAIARVTGKTLKFHGMILSPNGDKFFEKHISGSAVDAVAIGNSIANTLRHEAGSHFFSSWF